MRLVRITSVNQIRTGIRVVYSRRHVTGIIRDAKIYRPKFPKSPNFYLCQNRDDGSKCRKLHRQGYEYSWYVGLPVAGESLRQVLLDAGILGLSLVEGGAT